MAGVAVSNETNGWLVLWLEPLGEDRWLKAGEAVRITNDYSGDKIAFAVSYGVNDRDREAGIDNVTIWVNEGDAHAKVVDEAGHVLECSHQRPVEIDRRWQADLDKMRSDAADRKTNRTTHGGRTSGEQDAGERVTFNAHILESGTQSYRLRTSKTTARRKRAG